MENQNTVNPDLICQQAVQAKLNVYQSKESFETVLKMYNDQVDNLISLVSLMKNHILDLEGELKTYRAVDKINTVIPEKVEMV